MLMTMLVKKGCINEKEKSPPKTLFTSYNQRIFIAEYKVFGKLSKPLQEVQEPLHHFLFPLQLPQFGEDRGNTDSISQRIWYTNQSHIILPKLLRKVEFKSVPILTCHSLLKTHAQAFIFSCNYDVFMLYRCMAEREAAHTPAVEVNTCNSLLTA